MRHIYSFLILIFFTSHSLVAQDYQFTSFDMSNTSAFTTDFFRGVAVGKYGHVWVGSNKNGLYRFNDTIWEKASILQDHSIRALYMAPIDSTIWVAQSGKSSSGGSSNINGGVHQVLDTLYDFNYYGAIAGLPSRACYGIYVDNADKAWSAHGPHFNGSGVDGGGLGTVQLDVADHIYAGLPSGDYSEDAFCSAIGSGSNVSEIWVGVRRACYSGNCDSAYIAKYDTDGNFLGKITGLNSPLPFDNTTSGPTVKAIDFDIDGRAWVGLSSGDIYVFDGEFWNYINEDNPVIPSGASIHAQAITHNDYGQVYIGTTMGLLVYNGGGLFEPAGYQLFTTDDGLPSDNITGVCYALGSELWLTTGAGVVLAEQTAFPISGSVYNVNFSMVTGEYTYYTGIPETNDIEAVSDIDPSVSISETIQEDGSFYFEEGIDPYDSYKIQTYFDEDFWSQSDLETEFQFNYHNTIPGTTGLEIVVPQKILETLYDRMQDLESEQYDPIGDIQTYQEFMLNLGIGPEENNPEEVYHTLARVIIADRLVYMLDDPSEEAISASVEMFATLMEMVYSTIKKVFEKQPANNEDKVKELLSKVMGKVANEMKLTSSLESILSKTAISVAQKAFIKGLVFGSEEKFMEELVTGATIEAAKWGAKIFAHYKYRESVNDSVGNNAELLQMIADLNYQSTTEEAFTKVISLGSGDNSLLETTMIETTEAIEAAEAIKIAQEELDIIADFIDLFAGKNPKLFAIVKLFKGLSYLSQATATYIVVDQAYQNYDATVDGAYLSMNPYYDDKGSENIVDKLPQDVYDDSIIALSKSDFDELKQQLFMKLDSLLFYVNNDNQALAESKIVEFNDLETELSNALFLYKAPIIAKSQNAVQQVPEFDSIYNELMLLEQHYNFDNVGALIWMAEYLEDEDFENDTLSLSVDSLMMSLDALEIKIDECLQLTEDIEAPAFVAVVDHWAEGDVVSNEPFVIVAQIKNVGAVEATDIYSQLKIHSSVSILTDSIIQIGSLMPDEETEVEWTVELQGDPIQFINYHISIDSTLALTQHANSMLGVADFTTGINDVKHSGNQLLPFYPNPNKGTIHIQSTELPEGIVELEVLDLIGQVIHKQNITNERGNTEMVISLDPDISEGVYIIRAVIDGLTYSNKMIIQ